ncbi:MAG: serine/threonine-protein kinase, partial [Acidobacteriota bacterium]
PLVPYLVMEHVDGLALTTHAARRQLDLTARLELLAKIADAVQHAHDRGVIHRDLKPSNVLVGEDGQPRVIDFGVARGTDQDLTRYTMSAQIVGTLSYMSPEQVSGTPGRIGPATDVYALGVLAHQLLTDSLPLELAGLSLPAAIQAVQQSDPVPLGRTHPELAGDVEAIVAKSLEKEPERRYASAAELAADLRRTLASEPILARPPSAIYRMGRFVRRHRTLTLLATALAVALTLGTVVSSLLAVRARRSADEARHSADRAHLAAALGAVRSGEVAQVRAHLRAVPEERRGWAWRHVEARSDDAIARLSTGLVGELQVTPRSDGALVAWAYREELVVVEGTDELREVARHRGDIIGVGEGGRTLLELRDGVLLERDPLELDAEARVLGPAIYGWILPGGRRLVLEPGRFRVLYGQGGEVEEVPAPASDDIDWSTMQPSPHRRWLTFTANGIHQVMSLSPLRPPRAIGAGVADRGVFTEDGARFLSWSSRTIRCHETGSWRPCSWDPLEVEVSGRVGDLEADARSRRFVFVDWSGTTSIHDLDTGAPVTQVDFRSGQTVSLLSGAGLLVLKDRDGDLKFHELSDGRPSGESFVGHAARVHDLRELGDGRLVTLDDDGELRVFPPPRSVGPRRLVGHEAFVYAVDVAFDSRSLVSAAWDRTVRSWDAWTGQGRVIAKPGSLVVSDVSFGPDQRVFLAAGVFGVSVHDVVSGERRAALTGRPCVGAVFSPDGDRIYVRTKAGKALELWDAGLTRREWILPRSPWGKVRPLPDGEHFHAVHVDDAGTYGTGLFKVDDGSVVWERRTPEGWASNLALHPDGRLVAEASSEGTVVLRETRTGELVHHLEVPGGHVHAVVFHPGGDLLATGSEDGTVQLWDPQAGVPLARLSEHELYVHDLAFSPDGSFLVSASGDGTLHVHDTVSRARRFHDAR